MFFINESSLSSSSSLLLLLLFSTSRRWLFAVFSFFSLIKMPFVLIIISSKMNYTCVIRELKEYQGSSRALYSYCYYNNNASSNDDDVSLCLRERSDPHEGDQTTLFANKSDESFCRLLFCPSFFLALRVGHPKIKISQKLEKAQTASSTHIFVRQFARTAVTTLRS